MSILYFHGLDRSISEEERMVLSVYGEVLSPEIDYQPDGDLIAFLYDVYKNHDIEALVGVSMGGLIAYELSCMINKPCLIFNPALDYRSVMGYNLPSDFRRNRYLKVVIGQLDDVVDHKKNIKTLYNDMEEKEHPVDISIKCNMRHGVPLKEFEQEVKKFFIHLYNPVAE